MKVLIIGFGSIGKKHAMAIREIEPHAEIFALRHSENADLYENVINLYDRKDLNFDEFDFTIISNPTSEHKKTLEELLQFKVPLFIEKPIHSSLDLEEVVNKIKTKNTINYVACNLRFLECIEFVKENISMPHYGQLNEVNIYCGSYLPSWRPDTNFRNIYSSKPELGGGVHIDLIHEIDYAYWLFGKPLKTTRTFRNKSSLQIEAFDYAVYLLEYDNFCVNIVLNYYRKDPKRSLELVFENNTLKVDLLKNQVACNNEIIFQSSKSIKDTYRTQIEYFMNCLKNNTQTMNTVNDAFNVLEICLENDTKE